MGLLFFSGSTSGNDERGGSGIEGGETVIVVVVGVMLGAMVGIVGTMGTVDDGWGTGDDDDDDDAAEGLDGLLFLLGGLFSVMLRELVLVAAMNEHDALRRGGWLTIFLGGEVAVP